MQNILNQLKSIFNWQILYQEYARLNQLPRLQIQKLSLQNLQNIEKHLKKLVQKQENKIKTSWVSTQYQILKLFANAISVIQSRLIQNFNQSDWIKLNHIFYYKDLQTIKYELIRIVFDKKQHRRRWSAQQQNFLIEIVKKSSKKNKWNEVARQLFILSNGQFYRQGKHCRERWLNHLHPSIQNQQWSQQQDLRLLRLILKKGKKWAKIAKNFSMKRSQCMVKKRFFQLINKNQSLAISNQMLRLLIKKTIQDKTKSNQVKEKVQEFEIKQPLMKIQQDEIYLGRKKSIYMSSMTEESAKQNLVKTNLNNTLISTRADLFHNVNKEEHLQKLQQKEEQVESSKLNKINYFQVIKSQNIKKQNQLVQKDTINWSPKQFIPSYNEKHLMMQNQGFRPYQPFGFFQNFPFQTNGFNMSNYFFPYDTSLSNMNMYFVPNNYYNSSKKQQN